jgi:DNA-binding response OmpR family regulator
MVEGPILIVDDDPLFRDTISTALSLHGFRVRVAADGRDALAAIEDERPALVLLDMSMPVLDGAGLLRELAARGIRLPVVIVTAGQDSEAAARRLGVAAYVRKPVALPRLLDAINACGSRSRTHRLERGAA